MICLREKSALEQFIAICEVTVKLFIAEKPSFTSTLD